MGEGQRTDLVDVHPRSFAEVACGTEDSVAERQSRADWGRCRLKEEEGEADRSWAVHIGWDNPQSLGGPEANSSCAPAPCA